MIAGEGGDTFLYKKGRDLLRGEGLSRRWASATVSMVAFGTDMGLVNVTVAAQGCPSSNCPSWLQQ